MDIQSSIFNELFVLYPVIIRGWVTPVKPQGIAQGGIPKVLYDGETQGLECLIDPWTEMQLASWTMAADDRVDLYVNDNPTPATGKTVAPGEEQQRVRLYLPHGWLNQGVNRLYYKVTRVGGNDESSRDTLALYHLRLPESLDLIIPPEVVREGVGPELAARGVTFAFTYTNRRHFDSIVFALGDTTVRFDVPDAPAPINLTLLTDTFQRAGDNPNAVAEFRVFDQLGNAVMSGEKRVDIHLGRLSLLAPTVRGMNGNQFSPTTPEIRVLVPQGSLLPTDTLWVNWQGATAVPEGSYPSPPRLVSAGLEIAVPRSVLAYSLGQRVAVSYFIDRDDKPVESAVLLLDILPLPATALNSPKIVEADANNFLDITALGTKNATIHALLHTLIEAEQPCWLRLEGKKADGTAHDLTLWAGLPARVNSTWINQGFWPQTLANSYLVQLGHGTTLTLKYLVALDKSNIETNAVKFPDRVYTIKSVELVVPTLDRVLDSNGEEVLEGGWTVSTSLTLSGTASKGLDIEVFDDDGSSTVAKGRATADPLTGIWTREVTVAEGKHRLFARSLYHGGEVDSGARSFTVAAEVAPTIDSVKGLPSNAEIEEGGTTADTSVAMQGLASKDQWVEVSDKEEFRIKVPVNHEGVWKYSEDLTAGNHSYKVKAMYGSGKVSIPRTLKVVPPLLVDISPVHLSGRNYVVDHAALGWALTGNDFPDTTATRAATGGQAPYTYRSSMPNVVSVDGNGMIRSIGNGAAKVIVSDASGQLKEIPVVVSNVQTVLIGGANFTHAAASAWIARVGGSPFPSTLGEIALLNVKYRPLYEANYFWGYISSDMVRFTWARTNFTNASTGASSPFTYTAVCVARI